MSEQPLKILKASAGSGKTYALVQAFLKIVLTNDNPDHFARVMAMTFTNKAALEMKERVIKALVQLSFQDAEDLKFVNDTCAAIGIPPHEIQTKAKRVLKRILHNFNDLSVQTIDKFNIRLVRSFTRDLDLPGDFEILLDTEELLSRTIDKLVDEIGEKGKEKISNLLISFARHNIDEEKHWDFRKSLLDFLKMTEKEEFKAVIDIISRTEFTKEKKEAISMVCQHLEEQFNQKKDPIVRTIVSNNWTKEDFKIGRANPYDRICRIPELSLADMTIRSSAEISAVSPTEAMLKAILSEAEGGAKTSVPSEFFQQLLDFYNYTESIKDEYMVHKYAIDSFHQLALLKYTSELIKETRNRENILQISEVNSLISELIQSESAPFIYERIGTRYDNYLLDEFQDTSRLQWLNLIPLLHDSMGENNSNLIVGDAKQAIYRFRNGLVEQFAALPAIYNPEDNPEIAMKSVCFQQMSLPDTLQYNFRSKKEVVEFNNSLFAGIREQLHPDYAPYYNDEDLVQIARGASGGYVKFELSSPDNISETSEEEDESTPQELSFIDKTIEEAVADGYSTGDICILARKRGHCEEWANYLIKKGYSVISDEGMKVSQSPWVTTLVACLEYRNTPLSETHQLLLSESFLLAKQIEPFKTLVPYIEERKFDFRKFCNDFFQSESALDFTYENLYDFSQHLLKVFQIRETDDPYIHYFCNMLLNFDLTSGPDLSRFLEYYRTKGHKESIPLPEQSDAITIMTVHKSKGLEFPIVLLPNMKWRYSLLPREQYIFHDKQYDQVFYQAISSNRTKIQAEVYERKLATNLLDEVNLFYVACTRAVDRLYGFIDTAKSKGGKYLTDIIRETIQNLSILEMEEEYFSTYGSRTYTPHPKTPVDKFKLKQEGEKLWFPDISLIDKENIDDLDISSERIYGRNLHRVMQEITQSEELQSVIQQLTLEKVIETEFAPLIEDNIRKLLDNPEIEEIILPQKGEKVLDEREIILSKNEKIRPDRVIVKGTAARIIDYKTGIPREKDKKQILSYALALQQMGFEACSAYVLYTDSEQLIQLR